MSALSCELCAQDGGEILWRDARLRVVLVADADYAGYCRVIWNSHVAETTDLTADDRLHCMRVVFAVESVLRALMPLDKINLASLGNFTPHVHWHVIPRFRDDAHFPQAIWGERQRKPSTVRSLDPARLREQLIQALTSALR